MNIQEFDRALENISDLLIQEAAQVYEKSGHCRRRNKQVLRLTAIAAAVAILFLIASLLPIGDDRVSPYFAMYVYANEADLVELSADGNTFVFFDDISNDNEKEHSDLPLNSGSDSIWDGKPSFSFGIIPHESLPEYKSITAIEDFAVFCNGERVIYTDGGYIRSTSDNFLVSFMVSSEKGEFGYVLGGVVEEESVLEMVLYDEDGSILQKNTVLIQPIEGGYHITIQDVYVAAR